MGIKISNIKKIFLILLLVIPYLRPDFFLEFTFSTKLFDIWRILSFLIIVIIYVLRKCISKMVLVFIGLEFCIMLSTIINKGDIISASIQAVTMISFAMIVDYFSVDIILFIKTIFILFEILIYINFFSMLIFPNGLYTTETTSNNWFLGYDNIHIVYYLPAVMISLLYIYITKKKERPIKLLSIIYMCALWRWSATTIVGLSIILIFGFSKFFRNKSNIFNFTSYYVVSVVAFILFVVMRSQEIFSYILIDILGKDLTFANRTNLWDITLKQINSKPILGWGIQSTDFRHNLYNSSSVIHAHNQYLEYLYTGGIVLLLLFSLIVYLIGRKMMKNKENEIVQIISISFFSLQILLLTEVYTQVSIYLIYMMALLVDKIIIQSNIDNKNNYLISKGKVF